MITILEKSIATPSPLENSTLEWNKIKNYMSLVIFEKLSFIQAQSQVCDSTRLEMANT